MDVPTPIVDGDDDQIMLYEDAALASAKLAEIATLKIYKDCPHGNAHNGTRCDRSWHMLPWFSCAAAIANSLVPLLTPARPIGIGHYA